MTPYVPKGTLLGHDTKKVADARSVEALVDFSVSNMNWLKDDEPGAGSKRLKRVGADAEKAKAVDPSLEAEDDEGGVDQSRVVFEGEEPDTPIDPALGGSRYQDDNMFAQRLQQANAAAHRQSAPEAQMMSGAPDGYAPMSHAGYVPPTANMYPQPDEVNGSYAYPGFVRPGSVEPMRDDSEELVDGLRPFKRRRGANDDDDDLDGEGISMAKQPKAKKPRLSAAGFRSTDLADGAAPSSVKTGTHGQFEKEKEKRALEKARSEGRFIMLQAALRGKKRIVRLPIPGHRLAQVLAQQAAQAALNAGEEADAEHEVEAGAAPSQSDQVDLAEGEDEGIALLKSDIAPKKSKKNPSEYYEQRQKEGFVVSGATKKAMIPVEKDTSYGYYPPKAKPKSGAPQTNGKRVNKRMGKGNVEYEEVDIGSDEDFDEDSYMMSGANTATGTNHRRSIPNYLQSRYDDEDLPDELPALPKAKPRGKQGRPGPAQRAQAAAAAAASPPVKAKTTAGKRPSMRPSAGNSMNMDGSGDDVDVEEVVPDDTPTHTFTSVNGRNGGTPSSAPASRPSSSRAPVQTQPSKPSNLNQRQLAMDEENRLAKLQALEMLEGGNMSPPPRRGGQGMFGQGRGGGKGTLSMADSLNIDSDEEDVVEEVPARGVVRA